MKKYFVLFGLHFLLAMMMTGCSPDGKKQVTASASADTVSTPLKDEPATVLPDTVGSGTDDVERFSWEDIPAGDDAMPLDFEKWLAVMNHIRGNYWARPTKAMLADLGLRALYETDDADEDGIKDVHFIYGRQVKRVKDADGNEYFAPDGSHALLFEVFAYTSSEAEIAFHDPVDMRDFVAQAIRRGVVASPNGRLTVCEEPIGEGVHKLKATYRPDETGRGQYKELYYLAPVYEPDAVWQACHVTLDFLRLRLDIE